MSGGWEGHLMSDLYNSLIDATETGLSLSIAYLGTWIVFRVLSDIDITADASIVFGAVLSTTFILIGWGPWFGLFAATLGGAVAGLVTYALVRSLKLSMILASIIVSVGFFTVNLRVLGRPNVNLADESTLLSAWTRMVGTELDPQMAAISLYLPISLLVYLAVHLFLKSEFGLAFRAFGKNRTMAPSLGISPAVMTAVGLALANALIGLSGALYSQQQGYADVNIGIGTTLFGVTAILVGETLPLKRSMFSMVISVLLGTIAYRTVLSLSFRAGLPAQDFKGVTAVIVIAALLSSRLTKQGKRAMNTHVLRRMKTRIGASAK